MNRKEFEALRRDDILVPYRRSSQVGVLKVGTRIDAECVWVWAYRGQTGRYLSLADTFRRWTLAPRNAEAAALMCKVHEADLALTDAIVDLRAYVSGLPQRRTFGPKGASSC